jgi:uncharacterized membrane protein YhaH (DUF805 family)
MNFFEAVQSGFMNFIKLSGRAPRSEYFYWILFYLLVSIPIFILDRGVSSHYSNIPLNLSWQIFAMVSMFSMGVRRMHDIDKSAWWVLVPYMLFLAGLWAMVGIYVSIAFISVVAKIGNEPLLVLLGMVQFFLPVTLTSILLFQKGTVGSNRFGPDPLGQEQDQASNVGEALERLYAVKTTSGLGEKILLLLTVLNFLLIVGAVLVPSVLRRLES